MREVVVGLVLDECVSEILKNNSTDEILHLIFDHGLEHGVVVYRDGNLEPPAPQTVQ